jgi:DNA-binding SARP family transcriptional activator/Tfp pilus assembly protein PilF
MEFCLLGPLLVRRGDAAVPVPAGKQRTVLAALLLNANQVVPVEQLAEALWGAAAPRSARVTVQNYVVRLRKALGDEGHGRIGTRPRGYVISVADGELDTARFEVLLSTARQAAGDGWWDTAATQAREALALWRGEPLADVESELLATLEVPRLADLRLLALETRIAADLHLGRHAEVSAELRRLAAAHPLREHLHALLMLALYREGRQAEALAAYQATRQVLVEELGTEPGQELRDLHQQILNADAGLDLPRPVSREAGPERVVPQELPAGVRHFAGRAGELATLTGLLDETPQTPGMVVISAIGGTAGVGKTALAVHWAHQVAGQFPDGQLYVNLRGYDPDRPMAATDALAGFLRALGLPGLDIPAEPAERAAAYRSLLTGRRILVILDNAASAEQVRPLLPGAPGCTAVVTSRDALAGLVARDGAARLDLDLLPPADAAALLRDLIGARAEAEPGAVADLVALCSRLPLALRVAAEMAAARPADRLADLAGELADQQQRLALLDAGGDPRTAVSAVFSWSCRYLDPGAARAFRLLGLHPGPGFEPYAVAALTRTGLQQARQALDGLARAHLIQVTGPGRYGMHDLLRAYARSLADARETEEQQRAALTGLFDHYLHAVGIATKTLHPAGSPHRPEVPATPSPAPALTNLAAAQAWLETELANLVAVTAHTAGHGWPTHTTRLAVFLFYYLDNGSRLSEAAIIHGYACAAARQAADPAAEAVALNHLAGVHWQQSRYQQATDYMRQALALFRQAGDLPGEGRALGNLGILHFSQGHYQDAIPLQEEALSLHRAIGERVSEAHALCNLGAVEEMLGRYQQAVRHHEQSLAVSRQIGAQDIAGIALVNLGAVALRQGRYREAAGYLDQALALFREISYRSGEAEALARIGDVCLRQGRSQEAAGYLRRSLELHRAIGDRSGQADALNSLGAVTLAAGDPADARDQHATALSLASHIRDSYQLARAHRGLGHVRHAAGDLTQARYHWQQALAVFGEIGVPEADQVRAELAAADHQPASWPLDAPMPDVQGPGRDYAR